MDESCKAKLEAIIKLAQECLQMDSAEEADEPITSIKQLEEKSNQKAIQED